MEKINLIEVFTIVLMQNINNVVKQQFKKLSLFFKATYIFGIKIKL